MTEIVVPDGYVLTLGIIGGEPGENIIVRLTEQGPLPRLVQARVTREFAEECADSVLTMLLETIDGHDESMRRVLPKGWDWMSISPETAGAPIPSLSRLPS